MYRFSPLQILTSLRNVISACLLACSLSACMGGPIAQQVASSLLMRAADKVTSDVYEAHLLRDPQTMAPSSLPTATASIPGHGNSDTSSAQAPQFDEYWSAFLNAGFTEIKPSTEPLPEAAASDAMHDNAQSVTTSHLIAIEVWSLVLGEEKTAVLEQARLRGNDLSQIQELPHWQMAVGAAPDAPQAPVTFLIPPELGRVSSGQELGVEISGQGDLHIARYRMQSQRAFKQAAGQPSFSQP